MRRSQHQPLFVAIMGIAGLSWAVAHGAPAPLLTPEQVLERIEPKSAGEAATPSPESESARLLADIHRYRGESASLAPSEAATRWFALLDRAARSDVAASSEQLESFDAVTMRPVGAESMFASLPPPAAWPMMRKEAAQRASRAPADREALALRFMAEVLVHDVTAANATLDAMDKVLANQAPDERLLAGMALAQARAQMIRSYGSPDQVAQSFDLRIRAGSKGYDSSVEVPDLVGLVGEAQAGEMLVRALKSSSTLTVKAGDATRKLARKLALEHIDDMRVPQWELADSIDSGPLFEAIEKRFDPAAAHGKEQAEESTDGLGDYEKRSAAAWYFLGSVVNGRQAEAERSLALISSDSEAYIPKEAVEALRRAGQDEALFRFLDGQLQRRPQLRAWDLYIQEAAFMGRAADSLALIDKTLARKDLPGFLVADLRVRRIDALLSADRIDDAASGYRALLAAAPSRNEDTLQARFNAAMNAARVGRLVGRRDLVDRGLNFAITAVALLPDDSRGGRASISMSELWGELRRNGRASEAQSLAVSELAKVGSRNGFEALGTMGNERELASMVELASIWSAANRHQDVVRLLKESTRWGQADVARIVARTDSLKVYFGDIVARALLATGDRDGALRVARATLGLVPGNDSTYQLVTELDGAAPATLDALFARDEFEERPLIWKAKLQFDAGALAEAEATVRRAIAIDPSDGEQGPNDRMRAYAVLADILRKRGDTQGADTYAKAVDAIRRSERADGFHEAGLYERAFRGYREALEQFSDAYCIQSRLAVQLYRQGRRAEALEHYRRAYELMPDSFGRVESHCFGCESVFQGAEAQSIAEQVFDGAIRKAPAKPQAYYLLAYLREQQDRPAEALQPLRQAVSLDPRYLNAWVRLHDLGKHTYVEPAELDIATLKLLELDPTRRHVVYEVDDVTDLAALWRGADRARGMAEASRPSMAGVYRLEASAAAIQRAQESIPEEMRAQLKMYESFQDAAMLANTRTAPATLGAHQLLQSAKALFGVVNRPGY